MISDARIPARARSSERFTRNATLAELAQRLEFQQERKLDVVAPAGAIRARGGVLVVQDADYEITPSGVSRTAGAFEPTDVCDQGIAEKLNIPGAYLRKLRSEFPDLYDANVNGWLVRDERRFLVRTLRGEGGRPGVARAFLSNGYKIIDNYDALSAVLDGVRDAGVAVQIAGCDLSDRKMYVRVTAPEIRAYAPTLLRDYRSPFNGRRGADNPTVFAGFIISNSETGCGALSIAPQLTVEVCDNGMTITKDVARAVHTGARLAEGTIEWSDDTQRKTLSVITAQARDAVRAFLTPSYVQREIRVIEQAAGAPVQDADQTITLVSQRLKYTEAQRKGILDHFIRGGSLTAGGVLHAVTSLAQTVEDPDEAHDLENSALRAMELAAAA